MFRDKKHDEHDPFHVFSLRLCSELWCKAHCDDHDGNKQTSIGNPICVIGFVTRVTTQWVGFLYICVHKNKFICLARTYI